MKRLTLLRHAKSSWDDSGLNDHDRPLANRGLRDAPHMGERLAQRGLKPDLILSSTAKRAQETAQLAASTLSVDPVPIRHAPTAYLATPGELIAIVASVEDSVGDLILIGHNPGFTQLANMLLPDLNLSNLPTAGVVCMDLTIEAWGEIGAETGKLLCYDFPKNTEPPTLLPDRASE